MNYRHIYHAGSFTDVFKHMVLVSLLEFLKQKETAFCYLDTHAGIGRYDLQSSEAQRTQEHLSGIERLIHHSQNLPPLIQTYLNVIGQFMPRFYPGSPCLARKLLREQDRMILSELHPADVAILKNEFKGDKQVAVHEMDGYLALKAFLPPREKRGVVLIDPPYERSDEIDAIADALKIALERWMNGIYAIWYPIKEKRFVTNLKEKITLLPVKNVLITELSIYPEDREMLLKGSGMIIINSPWQFDVQLNQWLPWLWKVLSVGGMGGYGLY